MTTLRPKTKAAVLQIAKWQLGMVEWPAHSNKVKYAREYGLNGQPWCMMFVWWVFREAGFNLYKTASCTTFVSRYRSASPGQIVRSGYQPGDIVFFDFSGSRKKTEHVGIVVEVSDGLITTIEGNTSLTGSNTNGGAVVQQVRKPGLITLGVRPGYPD